MVRNSLETLINTMLEKSNKNNFTGIDMYSSCHSSVEIYIYKNLFLDFQDFSKWNNQGFLLRKLTENIFKSHQKTKENNNTRMGKCNSKIPKLLIKIFLGLDIYSTVNLT